LAKKIFRQVVDYINWFLLFNFLKKCMEDKICIEREPDELTNEFIFTR
jgi:hypothetical protein